MIEEIKAALERISDVRLAMRRGQQEEYSEIKGEEGASE